MFFTAGVPSCFSATNDAITSRTGVLQVANLCDLRFEQLVQEPGGQELVALHADEVQAAITRAVSAQIRCNHLNTSFMKLFWLIQAYAKGC